MSIQSETIRNDTQFGAHIMPRRRIDEILDIAARGKLVYVIAGAGYGKTQAVQSYIRQQHDAVVRWVQLTESDNIGSRYWENLTHNISFDNPELAGRLREFGFPETSARFRQFAEILKAAEHRSHKTFLVLDDFHLIHSKQALHFAERCAHLSIPGACVILLSRSQPEINAVSLFAKGQVNIVTEDELRFTGSEIAEFYKAQGILLSSGNLSQITDTTHGWPLALQLLLLVIRKMPNNLKAALEIMKQNIFKLMETEAFNDFPENFRKTLVKFSLISDLPLKMLREFSGGSSFQKNAPQLASFIWFDSLTEQDRVHPLYWEFLRSKQDMLTDGEKQETYKQAAEWCRANNFYLDSVKYLALSHQFGQLLSILLSYPLKPPSDMCEYILEILDNLTLKPEKSRNTSYLLLQNLFVPLLLLGNGKYDEAFDKCLSAIKHWKNSRDPIANLMLSIAYSNLTYIDMYSCTVTHKYIAPEHLKKSVEYQKRSVVPPIEIKGAFAVADIRSFACLVGEDATLAEFDDFLAMARETSGFIAETSHNMYYGYDDLVACELAYHKNQPEAAAVYANEAIIKAREKKQYSIEAMAAMYLFRVAVSEGDYRQVRELFRQRNESPETPYFWNRRFLYELGISFIYAQIGLNNMIPAWLSSDDIEPSHEGSVPVRELICRARFFIASKKYTRALTLLSASYPRQPHERFLLGELTLTALLSAARIQTGDTPGAVRDFEKAYALSFNGVFEMPFIELGRDLHPLIAAVSGQGSGSIPEDWLKIIDRKASAYNKKASVVYESFKKEKNIEDTVALSQREQEVLKDLYFGLSREEIAASRYLSVNTVHKIVQSLFIKLEADNKADAIRIAIEKNLLG